ncbi:stemmadenine O-acetyltransferase-like [Tripterygium wilfordii]|uniref:stemmadenine O-acetyltransferase-like n=1 Tax=Tripterygium wilfordii TaxID=458696 RepID=UPI0018F7FA83|nr:stemmadenine O-acetyltransferase-like [Tripterygium wilfordii]
MEIEIISRECVKPSSPTPHDLRTYKISLIDQFGGPGLVSDLFFYPPSQATSISTAMRSQLLKQSLSSTLTLYYPIAGRFIDTLSIDCNDEGLCYTVARANCDLHDYLKQPDLSKLAKFLPDEIICSETTPGGYVFMIQETVFACGGFAIGIVVPHHVFDITSTIVFLKTWATMARGEVPMPPDFSSSCLFPQNTKFPQDPITSIIVGQIFGRDGNYVFRRFLFEGSIVSNLKSKATSDGVHNPTRVEVVLALLFRCIVSALKVKHGAQKSVLMSTAVNLRSRVVPPLPKTSVGCLNLPIPVAIGDETDMCCFIGQIRECLSTINGEFLKSLQAAQGPQQLLEFAKETGESYSKALSDGAEFIVFNSWCNAGMYSVDFGWGKPIWFPSLPLPLRGSVIALVDARMSNGIEAWVSLEEGIMSVVERDAEILSLASIDPSPLQIHSLKSNL